MTDLRSFAAHDPNEPTGLLVTEHSGCAAFPNATAIRFELSSRGDRVNGRLMLPAHRSAPCPLIVMLGDAGDSCDSSRFDFAGEWIGSGFGVATIDLSLHGERASAKFSERLLEAIGSAKRKGRVVTGPDEKHDANGEALLVEFTRQSACDLSRTLDCLLTLTAIDGDRIGLLGLGHGAAIAAIAASLDPRPAAVVLAHCDAMALPELDPRRFVQGIGPRPILVLDAPGDGSDSLFDACGEPRQRGPSGDSPGCLSAQSAKDVLEFISARLGGQSSS